MITLALHKYQMMKKDIFRKLAIGLTLSLIVTTHTALQAQELYMPRNIKAAYDKGSRSKDGKPGKNYWQNKGKYQMTIQVNPGTKLVEGTETITYTNNSPDTLHEVAIRFVNNLHKPEAPRSGYVSKDFLSSGLDIKSFEVNGQSYSLNTKNWGTVEEVPLKTPLNPGQTAVFNISWAYPLSKESGREGQLDSTTFFVAYAFPRISVYDDYNGWDQIPHTDRAELQRLQRLPADR